MKKITAALIILLSTPVFPDDQILYSIGPAASYTKGKDISGASISFDASVTKGPINKPFVVPWICAGAGVYPSFDKKGYFYGEAGLWFFANVGVGYTFSGTKEIIASHLFFGVPIYLDRTGSGSDYLTVLEPYIRQRLNSNHATEFGFMLKYVNGGR